MEFYGGGQVLYSFDRIDKMLKQKFCNRNVMDFVRVLHTPIIGLFRKGGAGTIVFGQQGCKKQKSEITSGTKRKIKEANFEELSCSGFVAM